MRRATRSADAREMPLYRIAEAARYLDLAPATVRSWVRGRHYPTKGGAATFPPLIGEAGPGSVVPLSFVNLIELYVLGSLRRVYELRLDHVRPALKYVERRLGIRHPLAHQQFLTNGLDLFVQKGALINVSQEGQHAFDIIAPLLDRIDRDGKGLAFRFHPGRGDHVENVIIDPRISSGRPFIKGIGVPTAILGERYMAGDSIATLADDYGCTVALVEEAIRRAVEFKEAA